MNQDAVQDLEALLKAAASRFKYPPTPANLASRVNRRLRQPQPSHRLTRAGMAWAAALVLVIFLLALILVPPVRAAVLDFLQIGAVRIFFNAPATALPATSPSTSTPSQNSQSTPSTEDTGNGNVTSLFSLADLAGETTLGQAAQEAYFPIQAPSYPQGLGLPNHVYLQFFGGPEVILVWTQAEDPSVVTLALQIIGPDSWGATKFEPQVLKETSVDDQPAVWAVGPYMLQLKDGSSDARRLVVGNTLIWQEDGLTYRLESSLDLKEARRMAESMVVIARPATFPALAGETSLADAVQQAGFRVMAPAYPVDLGQPNRIFLQKQEGSIVLLVWNAPLYKDKTDVSLMQLGPGAAAWKMMPESQSAEATSVNQKSAVWLEGNHSLYLQVQPGVYQNIELVKSGGVLIWEDYGVTYRLEADITKDEAVRIAESLRPVDELFPLP